MQAIETVVDTVSLSATLSCVLAEGAAARYLSTAQTGLALGYTASGLIDVVGFLLDGDWHRVASGGGGRDAQGSRPR